MPPRPTATTSSAADATKFTLDNRVEVDGVGGAPGRFATLHDALDLDRQP